ncbi:hypothetical protein C4577_03845 [Candidatus Parcubacteria bacterium]|nr:MAG: hypothetical protein C4577_03845 [Candidatus Parcubacteria bacterium]
MREFRYKNILLYTTHQWCGNTEEYFVRNTEKLAVFLLMPRIQTKDNILRIYQKGKLVKTEETPLTANFFLYYFLWYYHYVAAIFKHFPRNEKLIVVTAHPYVFFAMTLQKLFRKIDYVYWIADYYPPINLTMILYEKLKKFYHKGIKYKVYLGDGVNKIMNNTLVNTETSKTILWGVKSKNIKRNFQKVKKTILFVGVIRPNVGLEMVYEFLKKYRDYKLHIIGVCDEDLYKKHLSIINDYGINKQVHFPNKFYFDDELNKLSEECFVGIALYDTNNTSTIYYADPGKVKAYTEMSLPVIMTKTSSIAPYLIEFGAGEVIDRNPDEFLKALKKIEKNYKKYIEGIEKFNDYFYYERYYNENFEFLHKTFYNKLT